MTEPTSIPTIDQAVEFYGKILTDGYRRIYYNFLVSRIGKDFADKVISKSKRKL